MEKEITIFLTEKEVELFKLFREHQTDFMALKANGIFDMTNGSLTLHFDGNGLVRKVESNKILFKI